MGLLLLLGQSPKKNRLFFLTPSLTNTTSALSLCVYTCLYTRVIDTRGHLENNQPTFNITKQLYLQPPPDQLCVSTSVHSMIQEVFQVYQQKWIQSIQFQARTREPGRQIVKVAPGHLVKIVHYDFAAAA